MRTIDISNTAIRTDRSNQPRNATDISYMNSRPGGGHQLTFSPRLDIPERIHQFRTTITVYRCLNGLASAYLPERCIPVTQGRSSYCLRSSNRHKLFRQGKLSVGSRSFCVSAWSHCFECLTWLPSNCWNVI